MQDPTSTGADAQRAAASPAGDEIDFFISRRGSAATVALEVVQVLTEAGHTSFTQDVDIGHGDDFLAKMDEALRRCRHFVVLLTRDYQSSRFTMMELTSFLAAADQTDAERRLLVLRVEDCAPTGLLAPRNYVDLVGIDDPRERKARIRSLLIGKKAAADHPRMFEYVPPRDLHFLGRDRVIERVHDLLKGSGGAPIALAAIHGLGGIGKTSLATEYAHRYATEYAGVWWAPAESRTLLVASLAEFAGRIDRTLANEPNLERAAKTGLNRLSASPLMLLVYDNVDAPATIQGFVPPAGARVLLTTRWVDWGGRAAEVKLDLLPADAAAELLNRRTGRSDAVSAAKLADALGRLPLALDHAGAYCRLAGTSFESYRGRIDTRITRAPAGTAYPASVAATFGLAIERAASQHKAAEMVLGFFAFLAPERIPLDLLSHDIIDEEDRAEALMALAAVSLIEHDARDDMPAVTLHRMVQAAMRARLGKEAASKTVALITRRLAEVFPQDAWELRRWPQAATLLPHVLALHEHILREPSAAQDGCRLLAAAGNYLRGRAGYAEAEPLLREALALGEAAFGPEHSEVARRHNDLGLLLWTMGRYGEAEPLYRAALAESERAVGRAHPDVASVLNNLARLLNDTRRREEAEPLFREAIATGEVTLGRRNAKVAPWLNNLAILLNESGRNAEAQPLYREAIAVAEATLGRDHIEVARSCNNLARSLRDTGDFVEAETYAREAIAIWSRMAGSEHPLLGRWQENLAQILLKMGRPEEALREAQAALASQEKSLGALHAWTLDSARTCAQVLDALGRHDEATAVRAGFRPGSA